MTRYLMSLAVAATALGLLPTAALAAPAKSAGSLHVYDEGKLFTAGGIDAAQAVLSGSEFDHGLTVTIDTYAAIPEAKAKDFNEARKAQFFKNWAMDLAKNERAKGIYVLVCRKPGHVEIIADKETRDRGFTNENEKKLRDTLMTSFKDAAAHPGDEAKQGETRDAGLKAAAEYVVSDLKGTTVGTPTNGKNNKVAAKAGGETFMSKYGGWLCLGLSVLLGVWVVTALIKALTRSGGGGGGGYGPGGGGGYGGGGGGGGFMSSMMGGLFGAAAGMYLYNNFMGGNSMHSGPDAYAGDSYGGGDGGAGDTGAGDFSGDTGAGGDFDDAGSGGGDMGGGGDFGGDAGGDMGGGGDFGGGGGDFGGGDF